MLDDSSRPLRGFWTLISLALLTLASAQGQTPDGAEPLDIIVFGASGRVGSRIVTEALNRGHRVTGVSRNLERLTETRERYRKVVGDVMDPASITGLVMGYDAIVSAIGGNNPNSEDPVDSYPPRAGLALVDALSRLSRRQREVVVLRYLAGYPEADVAEILECSVGTVKTHASRGLSTLRSSLS